MTMTTWASAALLLATLMAPAAAQTAVAAEPDHERLLASADARLAAHKRLVYDFWREVFEAGQLERADRYLAEHYIQHNPNVPDGRAGFVAFFGRFKTPQPVAARVAAPLVAITAEGDLVVLSFRRELTEAKDPGRRYTSTWFDMFRIENGRIVEHWDAATRP